MSATVLHMGLQWHLSLARHVYALAGRQHQTHLTKERTSPAPHTGPRRGWPRPTARATSGPSTATCLTPRTPLLPTARPSARSQAVSYPRQAETTPRAGVAAPGRGPRTMSCLLAKTRTALCRMSGSSTIACIPEQAYSGGACVAVQRAVQRVHCAVLCDTHSELGFATETARARHCVSRPLHPPPAAAQSAVLSRGGNVEARAGPAP